MKKKTILFIFSILVILLGILIFSRKIDFIKSIENIKSKKIEEKGVTKIDVTDLEDNGNLDHEHVFKTMFDKNKHWEECTICHTRNSEWDHSYIDNGWIFGNSCKEANVHKYNCNCGYGYTTQVGKPSHNMTSANFVEGGGQVLNFCRNSGCEYSVRVHYCRLSNGSNITCNNMGRCMLCGFYYRASNMQHVGRVNSNSNETIIKCTTCNIELGKVDYLRKIKNSNAEYIFEGRINLTNGNYYSRLSENDYLAGNHTISKISTSNNSTSIIFSRKINYNDYIEDGGFFEMNIIGSMNGQGTIIVANANIGYVDDIAPIINSITMKESEELTEWSRTKPIVISGTENYCKSVSVKIADENKDIIFEGNAGVNNPTDSNYSISCIPELEVDTNGKTYKAIVTDACGNSIEKEFRIAKIDAIPPTATSGNDITGEWSKSRGFTFKATDGGIGEVSIAFNDVKDLDLARFNEVEYSRDYEFYGDVYSPKQLSVLYRDKLGNTSIQKVTIDKLDNTAPTITNTSIHNNVMSIVANDVHEKLGEGSGVVKYRYITSDKKLDNPDVSTGKEINKNEKMVIDEIYNVKYIYIEAEDLVGNVSEVYEFKIPELVLTSRVDTSLADGKGGVILDWSTYDTADKYFVIYRKEENATEWENIVSLEERLTGSSYTDILANDKNKPNVSNINISGDAENNNIKINATSSDNGNKYSYYIEAYDDNKNLLQTSIKQKIK